MNVSEPCSLGKTPILIWGHNLYLELQCKSKKIKTTHNILQSN